MPMLSQTFPAERSVTVSLHRNYDWYNGFYLHVSGNTAAELLEELKLCTYTVSPWQTVPVTIAHGEALCALANFQSSVGSAPDFPRMAHATSTFDAEVRYDPTTASIPLLLNLYGSDLGHGIPAVALIYQRIDAVFNLTERLVTAIRDGELCVQFVALENGFLNSDVRLEHARRMHRKQIPTFNAAGQVQHETWCIANGVCVKL